MFIYLITSSLCHHYIICSQLLNVSGNEDLCYYNSLCSHPWRISSTLTLSALNNIISNIGYFILGFLFILIAYRRNTIYKAFEDVNRSLSREKKMGVPQYFGIYYAIGELLRLCTFESDVRLFRSVVQCYSTHQPLNICLRNQVVHPYKSKLKISVLNIYCRFSTNGRSLHEYSLPHLPQ